MQKMYYIHHRAGIISEVERYRKARRQYRGTAMAGGISGQMVRLTSVTMELLQIHMEAGIVNAEKWISTIAESIRILQEKLTV